MDDRLPVAELKPRAAEPDRAVLTYAIGGQGIDRDANILKPLAGCDDPSRADVAFILGGQQIGPFAYGAFDTGIVVGQPLNPGAKFGKFRQEFGDPDR